MMFLPIRLVCFVLATGFAVFVGVPVFSQEAETKTAVEKGQDALKSRRFPWYDAKGDQLQRTTLPVKVQPKVARDWTYTAPTNPGMGLNWIWRLLQYLVWGLLAAFFAYLLFMAIKSMTGVSTATRRYDDEDDGRTEADRIENLPFQMEQRRTGNLRDDAARLYEAGNFSAAIVYLFSHQLVELDKGHLIRLTKGKTNRQYMSELRGRMKIRSIVSQTMLAFEDVFFGHYELTKERFEQCWNQLDEFDRELQVHRDAVTATRPIGVAT